MPLLRKLPWIRAIAGLVIPLVREASLWPFTLLWAVLVGLAWPLGRTVPTTRLHRMSAALTLRPVQADEPILAALP